MSRHANTFRSSHRILWSLPIALMVNFIFFLSVSSAEPSVSSANNSAGITLLSPGEDENVTLSPVAQSRYVTPAQRGWKTSYDPQTIKKGVKDCSLPTPLRFAWIPDEKIKNRNINYELLLSLDADFRTCKKYHCGVNTSVNIDNLLIGQKYFWRIKASDPQNIELKKEVFSKIRSFRTSDVAPRWLNVPGLTNVRDIGGWKTASGKTIRQNMIFRGCEFDHHLHLEDSGKKILLDDLNIKTDLDLRGKGEWKNALNYYSPLGKKRVQWVNIPLSSYEKIFTDSQKKLYRQIFQILADEKSYPLYVHCWGGADRTGTLILVLNAILGVSDSDLCADYELTSLSIFGKRSIFSKDFTSFSAQLDQLGSSSESMSVKLERHLLSAGVSREEIEKIRKILLE